MSQSIGQKLAAARRRRDFTIEDVAHATRIQPDTLRHLEADDYSSFPTLTYAKSFLSMYSRHLGLDVSDYLKQFGPANGDGADIDDSSKGHREADSLVPLVDPPKRRPILTLLAILIFISAIPGIYILGRTHGFQSAKRFTVDTSSRTAVAAPAKPETADAKPAPAERRKPIARTEEPKPATVASRPAEVIGDESISMPDSGPVLPAAPIELPPAPAEGEEVEVRRPAVLIEDEAEETAPAPSSATNPLQEAPRAEVIQKAVPFEVSNN